MSDRITEAVERTRELHVPEIPLRSVYQIGGTLEGGGEGEGEGRSLHVDIDVVSPCGRARGRWPPRAAAPSSSARACAIIATEAQLASPRLLPESVVDQACEAVARELGVVENLELDAARGAARAASGQYEQLLDALGLITVGAGGERALPTPEEAIARARHLVATAAEVDGVVERIQRMIDQTEIGAPP